MESKHSKSGSKPYKKRKTSSVPRMGVDKMIYRSTWTQTSVSSGTTGTLSSWTSPSIIGSSEFSVISSLFTEVKLLKARFIFTPTQATNGSVNHFALVVSTNLLENQNTGVTPTAYSDVQNQTSPIRFSSSSVLPLIYSMSVPRNLEFASIASDAPSPATPWAGSPGVVKWYATGGTPSTIYFQLHVECLYMLRGRQ